MLHIDVGVLNPLFYDKKGDFDSGSPLFKGG
jgi:hypothetical protein